MVLRMKRSHNKQDQVFHHNAAYSKGNGLHEAHEDILYGLPLFLSPGLTSNIDQDNDAQNDRRNDNHDQPFLLFQFFHNAYLCNYRDVLSPTNLYGWQRSDNDVLFVTIDFVQVVVFAYV